MVRESQDFKTMPCYPWHLSVHVKITIFDPEMNFIEDLLLFFYYIFSDYSKLRVVCWVCRPFTDIAMSHLKKYRY